MHEAYEPALAWLIKQPAGEINLDDMVCALIDGGCADDDQDDGELTELRRLSLGFLNRWARSSDDRVSGVRWLSKGRYSWEPGAPNKGAGYRHKSVAARTPDDPRPVLRVIGHLDNGDIVVNVEGEESIAIYRKVVIK